MDEEVKLQMEELLKSTDKEYAHEEADKLLCDFLRFLGHDNLVDIYESIPKWYA